MIKLVSKHRAQLIYTRNTKGGDEEAAAAEKAWSGTTVSTSYLNMFLNVHMIH